MLYQHLLQLLFKILKKTMDTSPKLFVVEPAIFLRPLIMAKHKPNASVTMIGDLEHLVQHFETLLRGPTHNLESVKKVLTHLFIFYEREALYSNTLEHIRKETDHLPSCGEPFSASDLLDYNKLLSGLLQDELFDQKS